MGITAARLVCIGMTLAACSATPSPPPSAIPNCTQGLRVIPGRVEGAAGHRFVTLVFNNIGTTTCQVVGYPKVDLVDDEEHVVQHVRHTLRGQAGLPQGVDRPQVVTLRAGQSASAVVEASAIPEGDAAPCTEYSLMVTPPQQDMAVPASPVMMPDCDIQVHPVVAGDGGVLTKGN